MQTEDRLRNPVPVAGAKLFLGVPHEKNTFEEKNKQRRNAVSSSNQTFATLDREDVLLTLSNKVMSDKNISNVTESNKHPSADP